MRNITFVFLLLFLASNLQAQDKELAKKVKNAAKYIEDVANYNEQLLDNIKKAQNAVNLSDMKFYTEQALTNAEALETYNQYANDELLEIFDITQKKSLVDAQLITGKTEGRCLLVKTYCSDIYLALSSAFLSDNVMDISQKLGTARISSEVITKEMNLAMAECDQLKALLCPETTK